jgi:flagellar motor protein MotB
MEETPMKHLVRIIGTAVLFSVFGAVAPAYAQEAQHEEQAKPEQKTQQKQHAQQKQEALQAKSSQHAQQKQEAHQSKSAQHAQQARPAEQTQSARNDGGNRIPNARFRAHFGREHGFRIDHPVMVSGSPRFHYGGYWFGFGEPWPVGWYYTDQVYVDFIDGGYYLLSPVHPGVRISISIVV